jgi:hypothetical protein
MYPEWAITMDWQHVDSLRKNAAALRNLALKNRWSLDEQKKSFQVADQWDQHAAHIERRLLRAGRYRVTSSGSI